MNSCIVNVNCSLLHVVELVLTALGCLFLYTKCEKAEQREPRTITGTDWFLVNQAAGSIVGVLFSVVNTTCLSDETLVKARPSQTPLGT